MVGSQSGMRHLLHWRSAAIAAMVVMNASIVQARDICRVYYEGNTKVTAYCDDPMVCDHARPGKCKPGPELQRQRDEERRQQEEAARAAQQRLDQMRRNLDARMRGLRRTTRTNDFSRTANSRADDRRASGCSWEQNLGSRALYCPSMNRLSSNAYNDRIIPSPQYGKPRAPRGAQPYGAAPRPAAAVAPNSRPISMRAEIKLRMLAIRFYAMAPNDPGRAELQRDIMAVAKEHEALGETIAPKLKEIFEEGAKDAAAAQERNRGSVAAAPPPPQQALPPQQAAAPPPKSYSDNDETLCSYLMSLAPDQRDDRGRMTRLGQPVPASCEPYLRSLPRPADAQAAPEPAFYLPEKNKEEACKIAEEFYRERVFPPDYADLSVTERADLDRRASKCLTEPR